MNKYVLNDWYKNNTFNCLDFNDLKELNESKNKKTISLVIPTLNEEETIGFIISKIFNELNHDYNIIDEVIIIDGGSTDKTINIVTLLETKYNRLKLIHEKDILNEYKNKKGKGNQLWKGLYYSTGDIVLYCDSDIKNFDIHMITGMIGPLLLNNIKFIKGFYERPLIIDGKVKNNQGGRVTELCARPLLNLFYPELGCYLQPLGGEYGGYREVLENINYMSGYGVEIRILIEIYEKYGLNVMGQVDLLKRQHKHQDITSLTKMSFVIMSVVLNYNHLNLNQNLLIKNSNSESKEYLLNVDNACDEVLPRIKEIRNYYKINSKNV
tara:strand:+ start:954 stop:1928 length:975 start_codon:yes stop_codon:yes gene_type:complete